MTRPLSQTLARLAGERATGALLRDAGTLYLVDGVAVHAESPFSPGIGWLLTAGGRLPVAVWQEAVERAGARCAIARALVDSCRLSTGAVEIAGLSALFDAAFFVLGPSDGPSWFRPGVRHWFGALRSVPLRELERETARRRRYLEAVWPHPALDTAPVVRRAASARLPRPPVRRAAVLDLADGRLTPAGIAAALGRPAFHTLVDVRRLAALGHVATPSAEPERPPARPAPSAPPDPGRRRAHSTWRRCAGCATRWRPGCETEDPMASRRRTDVAYEAEVLEELGRLRSRLPGVTGVIAAGVDGLVLAEDAPGVEPEGIAALVAAALGVALRLVDVTGRRAFRELLIRGEDGYVGVYAAGASRVLAVLAEPRINVGRLHLEARRCGSALAAPRGAVRPAPAARPVQPASGRPDV